MTKKLFEKIFNKIKKKKILQTQLINKRIKGHTKRFQFYKEQKAADQKAGPNEEAPRSQTDARMKTNATINIGGRKQQMPFGENVVGQSKTEVTIREKLETLSPRQKAYLNDFLNLDGNDRDLVVDLGDAIFRYFRQRNVQF
jgi:hypothetical protein